MFSLTKKRNNVALLALVFFLVFSLIFGLSISLFSPQSYALAALKDKAISNNPYTPPSVGAEKINFEEQWTRSGYDLAYSESESARLNGGTATPKHLVIDNDRISFFGYQKPAYFDAVFTNKYDLDKLEFDFLPVQLNFHSLTRTGFFINSKIVDGKISGYLFAIEADGQKANNQLNISPGYALYEIKDMDLDAYNKLKSESSSASNYTPKYYFPSTTTSVTLLQENRTLPFTQSSSKMHFEIESTDTSFAIHVTNDSGKVKLFEQKTPASTDRGFGVFMQNGTHDCRILTVVAYENFKIAAKATADRSESQVNFVLKGTTTQIAVSQKETGYVGGSYNITPPTIEGYKYVGSSKDNHKNIAYDANSANNVTDLYYEQVVKPRTPKSGI